MLVDTIIIAKTANTGLLSFTKLFFDFQLHDWFRYATQVFHFFTSNHIYQVRVQTFFSALYTSTR